MELNADFDQTAIIHSSDEPWIASPLPGVDRRMLDRIGDEVARATSIVRYAPGSSFSPHVHTGGEEFIVLEGVFQDDYGDFPEGTYVRNPPTTKHKPRSNDGCTIFVKLWQFDPDDRNQFHLDMASALGDEEKGVRSALLHRDDRETVSYLEASESAEISSDTAGGIELLVLDGTLLHEGETFIKHSWLRLPDGAPLKATSTSADTRVWMKTGHLNHIRQPDQ